MNTDSLTIRLLVASLAIVTLSGCVSTGATRLTVSPPHLGDTGIFLKSGGALGFDAGSSGDYTVGLGQATPIFASQVLHNYGGPAVTNAITTDFVLPPLAANQVLNASSPIVFTMYWSTTATVLTDQLCFAVQLLSNDQTIGQSQSCTEGLLLVPTLGITYTTRSVMMSEVARLPAGSVLKLHLTFLGTLTDFKMSLTPPLQSHLNVSFVPAISGDVYLDSYSGAVTVVEGSGTGRSMTGAALQGASDPVDGVTGPGLSAAPAADPSAHAQRVMDAVQGTVGAAPATVAGLASDPAAASGPGVSAPEPAPPAAAGALAGTLLVAPLLALGLLRGPRRPGAQVALLMVMLVLGAGLAGCSSKKPPPSTDPQPTVEQYYAIPDTQRQATLEKTGTGDLRGRIFYDVGLPLKGAHVSLLSTDHFGTSDDKGRFEFLALPPTDYTIRVDSEGFRSVQQVVTVHKGTITQLNVTMVPVGQAGNSATTAHKHDVWGKNTQIEFFNGDSAAPIGLGDTNGLPVGRSLDTCEYYVGMAPPSTTSAGGDSGSVCALGIYPDSGMLVFPGTAMIDVTMSWDSSKDNVDAAGIAFIPANLNTPLLMAQKPSGSTWHIPVSQAMADRGHQGFTLWSFYAYVAGTGSTYAPTGPTMVLQAPMQVKMTLHKGLIPYEPAHKDFWKGNRTMEVLHDGVVSDLSVHYRDYPAPDTSSFLLPQGKLVPPGTGTLELKLTWKGSTGTTGLTYDSFGKWSLALHPANVQHNYYTDKDLLHPEPTQRTATSATFVVPLDPSQTDAYYQQKSNWVFLLTDGSGPTAGQANLSDVYYNMEFHLQATAILSPQYQFSVS